MLRMATMSCDGDEGWCPSEITNKADVTDDQIRRWAANDGWTCVNGLDFCPDCSARRKGKGGGK